MSTHNLSFLIIFFVVEKTTKTNKQVSVLVCPAVTVTVSCNITMILSPVPFRQCFLFARPTGNHEVTGLTPAEVGNILSWRLIMKYFLRSFPSADSRRAVVSFWPINVHNNTG